MSGYIFTLCMGAISWKTFLQSIAALSTTEVEYIATAESVKEAIWLQCLLIELGIAHGTAIVFFDSQSAIHLSKNDTYHSKTKYISVKYHFIGDIIV